MPAIYFFEVAPGEKSYLRTYRPKGYSVRLFTERADEVNQSVLRGADIISVFIYSHITAEVLKKVPRLKLIATRSTGFDHLDTVACAKRKVSVANVPFYGENTVAEHTFALILALSRKVHQGYLRTIRGDFSFEGLQGFDLNRRRQR